MGHINEKIDFCVDVYVVHQNKVLLRLHEKFGLWLTPGGHIELDEDPTQAAVRELYEETGLVLELYKGYWHDSGLQSDKLRPWRMNRHRINETHEHVSMIYLARGNSFELNIPEGPENAPCKWFTRKEINETKYNLKPEIKIYATSALDELAQ